MTGVSVINDGRGWHGFQTLQWPSGVASGTLRHLISGDEGSNRKVAAILDLLHGLSTSGQINAIGDAFNANKAAILSAANNLDVAAGVGGTGGWPWSDLNPGQNQYWGRVGLNCRLAIAARFLDPVADAGSPILQGVVHGFEAITAKECGLIGTTFTTANYEAMTGPLDDVLAMPSGY